MLRNSDSISNLISGSFNCSNVDSQGLMTSVSWKSAVSLNPQGSVLRTLINSLDLTGKLSA